MRPNQYLQGCLKKIIYLFLEKFLTISHQFMGSRMADSMGGCGLTSHFFSPNEAARGHEMGGLHSICARVRANTVPVG